MNKQTGFIGLIPVFLIILLILGAGYFLLRDEIKHLFKEDKTASVRRIKGYPTTVETDQEIEKQRKIIKSEAELNEFLNYIDKSGLLAVGETIDFNREYLIGVSSSTYSEKGHKVRVKKVYENKEEKSLLVSIEYADPAENCLEGASLDTAGEVTMSPTEEPEEPTIEKNVVVDIVAINKTDWEINFERLKQTLPCD